MSSEVENYYIIARRARDSNDMAKAEKYYEMILMQEPNSWEAQFYTSYCSAMQTIIANIASAASQLENSVCSVVDMIKASLGDVEQSAAIKDIIVRLIVAYDALYTSAKKHFVETDSSIRSDYVKEFEDRAFACINALNRIAYKIVNNFADKAVRTLTSNLWAKCISEYNDFAEIVRRNPIYHKQDKEFIEACQNQIYRFDVNARQDRIRTLQSLIAQEDQKIAAYDGDKEKRKSIRGVILCIVGIIGSIVLFAAMVSVGSEVGLMIPLILGLLSAIGMLVNFDGIRNHPMTAENLVQTNEQFKKELMYLQSLH